MSEKRKTSSDKTEDFDINKLVSRVIDNWKLFVVSFIAFIILGVLFIILVTPYYQISSQVLVVDDQNSSSPLSFMGSSGSSQALTSLFGVKSNVYNELGILETPDLLEKVTKDMKLNVTYFANDPVTSVELYKTSPIQFNFFPSADTVKDFTVNIKFPKNGKRDHFNVDAYTKIFGFHSKIKLNKTKAKYGDSIHAAFGTFVITPTGMPYQGNTYAINYISPDEEVYALQQDLTYEITDDNATIIALALNSTVPRKGEEVMQNLITAYIERNLNEKNRISDSTLAFIKGRVDIVAHDLSNIEGSIQQFKEKNKLANIDEQSKALVTNASDYYNKLNEVDVQLNIVKTMLDGVTQDTKRPVPTLINADPNFVTLVQKYNGLIGDKDRLLLSTTESNPLVQNIDQQLNAARGDMIKNLQNQESTLQTTRTNLLSQNAQLSGVLSNVPGQERQYIDLTRELDVKQSLYLFLLQQEESTAITKASNFPSASVISLPKSQYKPYFPSKVIVIGISIILGLMFPIGFIILKYILNNRIISRDDIKEGTSCPILAEIGHNEEDDNILQEEHSRTIVAEQFRIFRSNMDFLTGQKDCPKILITSSMSGEGKSFIAVNLAQVYAFSGKRVLLMEMDLRKPKISTMLNLPNTTGFSNYIISNQKIQDFIQPLPISKNVFLLSSGPIPPNPAELLMSSKINDMFSELSRLFDIIIVDSPPIGAVVDSQLLSKFTDVNLYVIRQQYSLKSSLGLINDIIENEKFPNLYLVVNDVKKTSSDKYGYGYGYGYGYSYGSSKSKKK